MTEPSTRPISKTELLERMRAGREEWDALIARIPDSARTEPALAGGWSVKDLIAHVAAFENWTAAQIRAANEGRAPTDRELYGVEEITVDPEGWDLDRENAAIHARYKETPLSEVMTFSSQAFADLVAAVEGVAEEDVGRTGAQAWTGDATLVQIIPGQCYAHYEQHADDLRSISGDDIP
ncbi:MAG TPA: ClbS/DfsB family four-helix bundle protein [Gemmatimonadales bacterium]|nr:ClbS/DfsB family four-helix bundle protein [Gemmatimonadales bacterium]